MIDLQNVGFCYKGKERKSIKENSIFISKGEVVVITGESGCGKSTLLRCINGLCPILYEGIPEGEIFITNKKRSEMNIGDISQIVSTVFQNPENQFFTLDVLSDMVFSCENFGIAKEDIVRKLHYVVDLLQIEHLLDKQFSELSGGEKQKIALASALMLETQILLMDEPSANLDYQSIQLLRETILTLKSIGYTILISEHRLYYLKDICDKLFIMADGSVKQKYCGEQLVSLGDSFLHEQGIRGINLFQSDIGSNIYNKAHSQKILLSLQNISFAYGSEKKLLQNINIDIRSGDRIALLGKNGSGKSTLAKIICGLRKENSGQIVFCEKKLPMKNRNLHISYVMQNVDFQIFGCSLYDDLLLGNEKVKQIDVKIKQILAEFNLLNLIDEHPMTLSMGQKQRLIIASSYILEKAISIFDEPTSGLDYRNMKSVCSLINSFTGTKNASIIISHDYEFIMNSCNRVVLLENGRIAEDFPLNNNEQLTKIFKERL